MKKRYIAAPQIRIKEAKTTSRMLVASLGKAGNANAQGITSADAKWRDYDDEEDDLW